MFVQATGNPTAWNRCRIHLHISSLERIFGYTSIEHEPKPTKEGLPPAYWPASGQLEVANLSAQYSADGPKVLEDVSFKINSGQRIGVGEWE